MNDNFSGKIKITKCDKNFILFNKDIISSCNEQTIIKL